MSLFMNTCLLIGSERHACTFNPMTSKDSWPHIDLGYKINKPKLRKKPERPRKSRIKAYDEVGPSKKRKTCSECHEQAI